MIINAPQTISPRIPMGVGDTNLAVKWNFRRERGTSRWPALTIAFAVEVPTGDSSTQLGSGVFDYRLIAIAQKTLSPRIKLRVNQGLLFSGNTLTGVVGLRGQGFVYLAGVSLVRRFARRLSLGVELTAARDPSGRASRAALQEQLRGKYQYAESLTIDFGVGSASSARVPVWDCRSDCQ